MCLLLVLNCNSYFSIAMTQLCYQGNFITKKHIMVLTVSEGHSSWCLNKDLWVLTFWFKTKKQKAYWKMAQIIWKLRAPPGDTCPPSPHLLNLPKQFHIWVKKYKEIWGAHLEWSILIQTTHTRYSVEI